MTRILSKWSPTNSICACLCVCVCVLYCVCLLVCGLTSLSGGDGDDGADRLDVARRLGGFCALFCLLQVSQCYSLSTPNKHTLGNRALDCTVKANKLLKWLEMPSGPELQGERYLCGTSGLSHEPRSSFPLRLGLFVSDWSLKPGETNAHRENTQRHEQDSFTGMYLHPPSLWNKS